MHIDDLDSWNSSSWGTFSSCFTDSVSCSYLSDSLFQVTISLLLSPQIPNTPIFPPRGWPCFLLQWGNWSSLKRTFKDCSFIRTDVPTSAYFSRHYCKMKLLCSFLNAICPFLHQIPFLSSSLKDPPQSRKSIALGILPSFHFKLKFPSPLVTPISIHRCYYFFRLKKKTKTTNFSWAYSFPSYLPFLWFSL